MSINFLNNYEAAIAASYQEAKKAENPSMLKFKEIMAKVGDVAARLFVGLVAQLGIGAVQVGAFLAAAAVSILIGKTILSPLVLFSPVLAIASILIMWLALTILSSYCLFPLLLLFVRSLSYITEAASWDAYIAKQNYQQAEKRLQLTYDATEDKWRATQADRLNLRIMNLNSQDPAQAGFLWNELPDEIKNDIAGYVLGCDPLRPT